MIKQVVDTEIGDWAGQFNCGDGIKPRPWPIADIFMICFSIGSRSSYENVRNKWVPEINAARPDTPLIIIGTKLDLRNNGNLTGVISEKEGEQLAKECKALEYLECSALTKEGLKEVFDEAIRLILNPREPKGHEAKCDGCVIL